MRPLRIAVAALLAACSLWFSLAPIRGLFWLHPGDFGVAADSSMQVIGLDSPGPAYDAGLRVGDRLEAATPFEKRLYLQQVRNPAPGQLLTLRVKEKNGSVRVVAVIAKMQVYDALTIALYFPEVIVDLILLVVGSVLVLLRPSKMTSAFFLYCVGTAPGIVVGYYWLPAWLVFSSGVFVNSLQALGFAAFLVFCVRVPNNRAIGGWRYVEWVGAPVIFVSLLLCGAATDLSILGILHADAIAGQIQGAILSATYVIGVLALIATFLRERGLDRKRVAWILTGLAIGLGGRMAGNLTDLGASIYTGSWLAGGGPVWLLFLPALQVAIPLTVAYAVIRHHALNVGFIANRTLVYGLFLCAGFAAFAVLDLLATKRFAHNEFEVGLDVAVALGIGLSFQFVHPRAIRLIDRVFLPERYHAALALDKLRATLGPIRSQNDAANRAVDAVAKELTLSSLALFKKMPDGGFVRFAAAGWPKGSAWHIFAGDPLVQSFGSTRPVRLIDEAGAEQLKVPLEPGRPSVGMSLSPQTPDESLLLVGAHVSGRRPDGDEMRGIASLLHEFAIHKSAANLEGPG
ncbi:MAG: hypothetical protein WBE79_14785 [Candidatus Cybelea sp.]